MLVDSSYTSSVTSVSSISAAVDHGKHVVYQMSRGGPTVLRAGNAVNFKYDRIPYSGYYNSAERLRDSSTFKRSSEMAVNSYCNGDDLAQGSISREVCQTFKGIHEYFFYIPTVSFIYSFLQNHSQIKIKNNILNMESKFYHD